MYCWNSRLKTRLISSSNFLATSSRNASQTKSRTFGSLGSTFKEKQNEEEISAVRSAIHVSGREQSWPALLRPRGHRMRKRHLHEAHSISDPSGKRPPPNVVQKQKTQGRTIVDMLGLDAERPREQETLRSWQRAYIIDHIDDMLEDIELQVEEDLGSSGVQAQGQTATLSPHLRHRE